MYSSIPIIAQNDFMWCGGFFLWVQTWHTYGPTLSIVKITLAIL